MNYVVDEQLLQFGDTFGTMRVRIWSAPQSRGTIFCIPRFEGNGGDFNWISRRLSALNFTVVCPDLIGRGKSTYFGNPDKYNYHSYITCLTALLKYWGPKNVLLGTSWGGVIGTYFSSALRIKFDRIALNDVRLRDDEHVDPALQSLRDEGAMTFPSKEAALNYLRSKMSDARITDESVWMEYLSNRTRLTDGGIRMAYDPALPWLAPSNNSQRYNLLPLLTRVDVPILLLYSEASSAFNNNDIDLLAEKQPKLSYVASLERDDLLLSKKASLIARFIEEVY